LIHQKGSIPIAFRCRYARKSSATFLKVKAICYTMSAAGLDGLGERTDLQTTAILVVVL
jgi:hypothetical protein